MRETRENFGCQFTVFEFSKIDCYRLKAVISTTLSLQIIDNLLLYKPFIKSSRKLLEKETEDD